LVEWTKTLPWQHGGVFLMFTFLKEQQSEKNIQLLRDFDDQPDGCGVPCAGSACSG